MGPVDTIRSMRTARTLSLYVMRETLVHSALALLGVTLLLVMQNLIVRLDEFFLIGMNGRDLGVLVACLLPVALSYSIPLALLVGIGLAVRRLGSDGELLGLRSCGVGPGRLFGPNFLLGAVAAVGLAWLVTAYEHVSRRELVSLFKQVAARGAILEPGRFRRLGDHLVFVEDRTADGGLAGVMIQGAASGGRAYRLFAERGRLTFDDARAELRIDLSNGDVHLDPNEGEPQGSARIHFEQFSVTLDVEPILGRELGPVRPKQMTSDEIEAVLARAERGDPLAELDQKDPLEYALELERRRALPFAPLLFAGVGVPIALASERRGRNLVVPLLLAVAVGYFALGAVAESIAHRGWLPVRLASWMPNGVFLVFTVLLVRYFRDRIPR